MIAQRSPGVQDSPSSAARRRPDLRALSPDERLRRKAEYFAENPDRRTFLKSLDDVSSMVGPGPALVYSVLLYRSAERLGEAPVKRMSYAEIAKRTRFSRETVATYVATLAAPAPCRFCETAHPLVRKLGQRYPTARSEYAILDDCAHVDPSERVAIANVETQRVERFEQRSKNGRFSTEAPIAEQLTLGKAPELAGFPANCLVNQPPRSTPSRTQKQAADAHAAVRALMAELAPIVNPAEISEAVIGVVAEHVQGLLIRMVAMARAEQVPLTPETARLVLDAAPVIVPAAAATAPPVAPPGELAGIPANSEIDSEVFAALVTLARGKSSPAQLRTAYTEELLPYAFGERDGDRAAADRLLLDVLTSERVRNHRSPIALLRDAACPRKPGTEPYLAQLSDFSMAPRTFDARAKKFAGLPAGEQAHILALLKAHFHDGAPLPQRKLEEADLAGKPMLEYLQTMLDKPIS